MEKQEGFVSRTNKWDLEVVALSDQVIAVHCHSDYSRSKPSFLIPEPPRTLAKAEPDDSGSWTVTTHLLRVQLQADTRRVRIYRTSSAGEDPICELRDPSPTGGAIVIDRGFTLYGVGASSSERELDRRGKCYRVHHRETGQGNNYMPWVLSAQGFGLFFDSTFPMTLDLRDQFTVEGRNIRTWYFIDGPTPAQALQAFVALTGLPPLHPGWALGFEQSSRTWLGRGELDFVTGYLKEKGIPASGFPLLSTYSGAGGRGKAARGAHAGYLDGYQGWNVKGTYRQYNPKLLPGGARDIKELIRDRGLHPIVHGYWAGDYSDPEATEAVWQDHRFLLEDGFEGWWLDGAETVDALRQDLGIPAALVAKLETPGFRDEYDNIWALLRAKAFYEKQRRDFPDRRVYILNRTGFVGLQRYAGGMNQGDYWSNWELMRKQTVWLLSLGLSGITISETDIGGHYPTEELTEELFIRWAFLATFSGNMRSHGHNWRCRLPWGFGPENEVRFTQLIRLRTALFPYNYSLLRRANQTGLPPMRAMLLEFPEDREARGTWDQFMWGRDMLVAPVYEKGRRERAVYLPGGTWVDYWGMRTYEGPGRFTVEAPLGSDALFLRSGAIIPMARVCDSVALDAYRSELTLLVLPARAEASFSLYDDDHQTYRYEKGEWSEQVFALSALGSEGSFSFDVGAVTGQHEGVQRERAYRIEIPRSLVTLHRVAVAGEEIPFVPAEKEPDRKPYWTALADRYAIELPTGAGPYRLDFA